MLEEHKHQHSTHNFDGITENRVNSPPKYFSVLFYGLIIWGVLFCGYYLLSGWSSHGEFEEKMAAYKAANQPAESAPAAAPVPAEKTKNSGQIDAAALFAANCAGCHGADGKGGFGSDLTRKTYTYGKTKADIRESITEGRGGKMPAFKDQLSDAEIDALANFALSL